MKTLIIIAESILLLILAGTIFIQTAGLTLSTEEVFKLCQPDEISYEAYDPYCISIIKQQQALGSTYIILVAQETDPTYGHTLNYPAPYVTSQKDLEDTTANWTNDGIEIETYLNTRIFIPKENFTKGR